MIIKAIRLLSLLLVITASLHAAELKPYKGSMQVTDFILRDMQGKTHQLSRYRGNVVLINFWATWCPPCVEELPSMQRLQNMYKDKPFTILTIDVGEPAELIQQFLEKVDATELTVLLDKDGSSHKDWKIYVFPTNFLLDKSGTIRYANVGALNWDESSVTSIIDQLLK